MKIVQESKRVLVNLYATLSKGEEKVYEPGLKIVMDDYAQAINMTKENLNLYLWFLQDAGYITCEDITYDPDDAAVKKIYLTPIAIRMLENNDSI